ncbi:MAG: DUF418 domain-containing protein [Acidobacteria bacterium]|nr:DUF418 domain-containing protein [Acidobacteriota bacterium]
MAEGNLVNPAPVEAEERVEALDTVRGFALLGILLMNICSFGMPSSAEGNPTVWGGSTGADYWLWWVQAVFWSGKMRALFSMCFGAGVIYLTSRAEAKGVSAGDVYYRRTFWLMVFGMIHAYLFWYGDILYPYALYGLMLYPLRKMPARWLTTIGVLMVVATCVSTGFTAKEVKESRDSYRGIPEHAQLAKDVEGARGSYQGMLHSWQPDKGKLDEELKAYRGTYAEAFANRSSARWSWDSQPYFSADSWDILAFMLIGMALAKRSVLAGSWPLRTYLLVAVAGMAAGTAIGAGAANHEAVNAFSPIAAMESWVVYQLVRLLMSVGYLAAIVGVVQLGWMTWLTGPLSAVGRMAFSNYIMHTLICTTLFYGHGFGWFGKLQRHELYYVVVSIWVLQLIVSPLWLRVYRFGPLEWCWRSLTYWQRQPMRIRPVISEQSFPAENPA